MLERYTHALSLPQPFDRDVQNLKRWTDGTGSVSARELKYLDLGNDLMNLTGSLDTAITFSESVVEDCTFWLDRIFGRVSAESHLSLEQPPHSSLSMSSTSEESRRDGIE